jgi:hypothetical protein
MRQFSDSSLEHWMNNKVGDFRSDSVVYEAIKVIAGEGSEEKKSPPLHSNQNIFLVDKTVENA